MIILHQLMVERTVQEVILTRSHVILITVLVMDQAAQVTLLEKFKKQVIMTRINHDHRSQIKTKMHMEEKQKHNH